MTYTNPSPEYNFVNINSATTRCMRLLGKPETDHDTTEHIQELLILSAASKPNMAGVNYYRPYIVAAILLSQDLKANNLEKAGDVVFRDKAGVIQSLLSSQASIDKSQGWLVTSGFAVADILGNLGIMPASKPLAGLYPSSVPVKVVF